MSDLAATMERAQADPGALRVVGTVPTLGHLADRANREHLRVVRVARSMLAHAIAAGHALNEAKAIVPHGEWEQWLADNFEASACTANTYRRIALHTDILREHAEIVTVDDAHHFLRRIVGRTLEQVETERQEARALRETGLTTRQIAERFGVDRATVSRWLQTDGKFAQRRRRVIERTTRSPSTAGFAAIVDYVKAAGEARREGDVLALADALEKLAAAAHGYAQRLRDGTARAA